MSLFGFPTAHVHRFPSPTNKLPITAAGQIAVAVESVESVDVKPVLNYWENCLFAQHTSDSSTNYNSFLNIIELLVRGAWFGQFDELCFVFNWLIMRCKLRPELAAEAQHSMIQNVG